MTRKAATKIIPREDDEQRAVVDWLNTYRIAFTAVPNGGKRSRIEAAIMVGLGVQRGFPDLIVVERPPAHPDALCAAIELKRREGGVVSPEQEAWLARLQSLGWVVAVCEGADEAIAQLETWGYGRRRREVP